MTLALVLFILNFRQSFAISVSMSSLNFMFCRDELEKSFITLDQVDTVLISIALSSSTT